MLYSASQVSSSPSVPVGSGAGADVKLVGETVLVVAGTVVDSTVGTETAAEIDSTGTTDATVLDGSTTALEDNVVGNAVLDGEETAGESEVTGNSVLEAVTAAFVEELTGPAVSLIAAVVLIGAGDGAAAAEEVLTVCWLVSVPRLIWSESLASITALP